ncbi:UbiA prenyltransferase family, partial [Baffinella frigidus]
MPSHSRYDRATQSIAFWPGSNGERTVAGTLVNLFISLRPWSFPATLVPVLLTAALVHKSGAVLDRWDLARALASGVLLQSAANASNTFWDYINGADRDTVAQGADSKTALPHKSLLVSGALSLRTVGVVSTVCYCASAYLLIPAFQNEPRIIPVYTLGVLLAIFYTAPPLKLKYHALGDVCVFATFGPMMTYWTLLLICPSRAEELRGPALAYTMPCAFICECILHANNSRDIREDRKSGLTTLATVLGFDKSKVVFQ